MSKKASKQAPPPIDYDAYLAEISERFDEGGEGEEGNNLVKMDGYNDCIVGIVERFGMEPILCYDKDKFLQKLMAGGMTDEEAVEWFEFNTIGAWVGTRTPCFLSCKPGSDFF